MAVTSLFATVGVVDRVDVGVVVLRRDDDHRDRGRLVVVHQQPQQVGGQLLELQGLGGVYSEIFLPLHGEHQAHNAVLALAAVEAFFGDWELVDPGVVPVLQWRPESPAADPFAAYYWAGVARKP